MHMFCCIVASLPLAVAAAGRSETLSEPAASAALVTQARAGGLADLGGRSGAVSARPVALLGPHMPRVIQVRKAEYLPALEELRLLVVYKGADAETKIRVEDAETRKPLGELERNQWGDFQGAIKMKPAPKRVRLKSSSGDTAVKTVETVKVKIAKPAPISRRIGR